MELLSLPLFSFCIVLIIFLRIVWYFCTGAKLIKRLSPPSHAALPHLLSSPASAPFIMFIWLRQPNYKYINLLVTVYGTALLISVTMILQQDILPSITFIPSGRRVLGVGKGIGKEWRVDGRRSNEELYCKMKSRFGQRI